MARYCAFDLWSSSSSSSSSRVQRVAGNSDRLTIFYNGRVSVCDVTENQVRAILYLARQEMEASSKEERGDVSSENEPRMEALPLYQQPPQQLNHQQTQQQQYLSHGLSMKRSLQRFFQKRKSRIQANFPYNH